MKNLKVDGMFTHLCCCESLEPEDVAFTKNQICRFYALIDYLKEHKVPIPKLHIQSSYGLLNYPELKCDYVREGISLYGVASTPQVKTTLQLDLRPALALKAKVILIRDVPQGGLLVMIGRIRLSVTVKLQFCRLAMGMDFREIYHAERQV